MESLEQRLSKIPKTNERYSKISLSKCRNLQDILDKIKEHADNIGLSPSDIKGYSGSIDTYWTEQKSKEQIEKEQKDWTRQYYRDIQYRKEQEERKRLIGQIKKVEEIALLKKLARKYKNIK